MLESVILAVITTTPEKFAGGAPLFTCESKEELEFVANNLEAILDGIASLTRECIYYCETLATCYNVRCFDTLRNILNANLLAQRRVFT